MYGSWKVLQVIINLTFNKLNGWEPNSIYKSQVKLVISCHEVWTPLAKPWAGQLSNLSMPSVPWSKCSAAYSSVTLTPPANLLQDNNFIEQAALNPLCSNTARQKKKNQGRAEKFCEYIKMCLLSFSLHVLPLASSHSPKTYKLHKMLTLNCPKVHVAFCLCIVCQMMNWWPNKTWITYWAVDCGYKLEDSSQGFLIHSILFVSHLMLTCLDFF